VSSEAASDSAGTYVLKLYVAGHTARSVRAIENIRRLCETSLRDRYTLEVFDVYQQPELASKVGLVAAPTLIKHMPPPLRRMIGDMSDTERVLVGLSIEPRP
jgi:circadian clock protein KaiB